LIVTRAAGDGSAAQLLEQTAMSPISGAETGEQCMYAHAACKVHPAVALGFAAARGFGLVIAVDGGRPVASLLPFHVSEADGRPPRVQFHVARDNPLAALAAKSGTWLLAVQGADAYVSPDWYTSSDQVPTWLYEAVHLSGPVHVVPSEHTADHVERLAAQFEAWLKPKPPWTMDRVSTQRREMLMRAIVSIEMIVETVEANFKLGQQKIDSDHVAIARALAKQSDTSARAIAARMIALRPHLAYETRTDENPP
jgi:transcriptional regulator